MSAMKLRSLLIGTALSLLSSTPLLAGKADDTLIWTTSRELAFTLPYFVTSREQLILESMTHDTLIYRTPQSGEYQPLLAKSWRWIDDTTLEFKLRDDVVFHNGKKLDADDVVYTLTYVSRPDAGVITRANVSWIKSVEKVDELTVRLHTTGPFPAALEFLAGPDPIFPKGLFDGISRDAGGRPSYAAVKPIGTGPYEVIDEKPGQSVTLRRNDRYFGGVKGMPKIKTIVFRTIPDAQTQIAELMAGGVDWMWELNKDQADNLRETGQVAVANAPSMRINFLQFDAAGKSGDTPMKDLNVRKAIAYAVNRAAIAKSLIGDAAQVINSACYPSQFGCTQDTPAFPFDLAKAKASLAASSRPKGFSVDLLSYRDPDIAEAIAADLGRIGVKVNIKTLEYKAMVDVIWGDKAQLVDSTWGSSSINDVSAITSHFFNGGRDDYCMDPDVKALLKRGDTSTDPQERLKDYKTALTKIQEKLCWLPMFAYALDYAFSKDLNFTPTADEIPQFYRASWK